MIVAGFQRVLPMLISSLPAIEMSNDRTARAAARDWRLELILTHNCSKSLAAVWIIFW
jgi:hypothetical protein